MHNGNHDVGSVWVIPSQAFVDLGVKKLDRGRFDEPIDPNESSNLRGSFAKVVKRNFDTHVSLASVFCTKVDKMYHSQCMCGIAVLVVFFVGLTSL